MRISSNKGFLVLSFGAAAAIGLLFHLSDAPFIYGEADAVTMRVGPVASKPAADAVKYDTESRIVGFFGGESKPTSTDPATALLFGDIMLSRSVDALMDKNGAEYPFELMKPVLPLADITAANLEGPVTSRNNQPGNRMVFHFDPSRAATLSGLGLDLFDLANNHAYDQSSAGAADTKKNLEAAGLGYFGDAKSEIGAKIVEARGVKFGFLGFQDVTRKIDVAAAAAEVKKARGEADVVIAEVHWGTEYVHLPNARQRMIADTLIDAGADAVVSHHPHVVQTVEMYNGRPIFYSLGNFVFDQYFSADTQEEMAVLVAADEGEIRYHLLPMKSVASQSQPMTPQDREDFLNRLANWSDPDLGAAIRSGVITVPSK